MGPGEGTAAAALLLLLFMLSGPCWLLGWEVYWRQASYHLWKGQEGCQVKQVGGAAGCWEGRMGCKLPAADQVHGVTILHLHALFVLVDDARLLSWIRAPTAPCGALCVCHVGILIRSILTKQDRGLARVWHVYRSRCAR